MSAEAFRAALDATGTPIAWLAKAIGRSKGAIRRWIDGSAQPPPELVEWLHTRASNPPPKFNPHRPLKKNSQ
jgi:hypothetical protein